MQLAMEAIASTGVEPIFGLESFLKCCELTRHQPAGATDLDETDLDMTGKHLLLLMSFVRGATAVFDKVLKDVDSEDLQKPGNDNAASRFLSNHHQIISYCTCIEFEFVLCFLLIMNPESSHLTVCYLLFTPLKLGLRLFLNRLHSAIRLPLRNGMMPAISQFKKHISWVERVCNAKGLELIVNYPAGPPSSEAWDYERMVTSEFHSLAASLQAAGLGRIHTIHTVYWICDRVGFEISLHQPGQRTVGRIDLGIKENTFLDVWTLLLQAFLSITGLQDSRFWNPGIHQHPLTTD